MVTYKGLPAPHICDFWTASTRPAITTTARPSRSAGSTWSPIPAPISTRPSTVTRRATTSPRSRSSGSPALRRPLRPAPRAWRSAPSCSRGSKSRGKAVLVHTGWDRHWRTDAYFEGIPSSTEAAARLLAERGAGAGRNRQLQYRRHPRPPPPGPHHPARRRHPDLRAYDPARRAAAERLPLHRRAAQGRRHGHLPGQGLRDPGRVTGRVAAFYRTSRS